MILIYSFFIITIVITLYIIFYKTFNYKGDFFFATGMVSFFAVLLLLFMFNITSSNIEEANYTLAQIQLMQPAGIDEAKLKRAEIEFNTVSNLIKETFDKYQIQAKTEDFKGFTIYTAPFSAGGIQTFQGLGDIERGSGEKLKNLEMLINKQWQLAEKIIELQATVYKPEFYTLNQELHILKYSAFDGIVVRWFLRDVKPVYNQEHYANGVNLKN